MCARDTVHPPAVHPAAVGQAHAVQGLGSCDLLDRGTENIWTVPDFTILGPSEGHCAYHTEYENGVCSMNEPVHDVCIYIV